MNSTDFGMGIKGVKNASESFYNKPIEHLTEQEIIELNLIRKSPYLYNPINHPNRVKQVWKKLGL